jgi:tetratricopeptide (TPR) repeat protein
MEILARCLWRCGDFAQALAQTRSLIRLNPYEPGYHCLRGACLQALGMYGEAVEAFERSLQGDENTRRLATQALVELEDLQHTLVGEMLAEDAVFRVRYTADPRSACESKGYRFTTSDLPAVTSSTGRGSWVQQA